MKTTDILAVTKRLGGRLLKDSDPELYKAELAGGASMSFLSRTSPRSEQKDSDSTTNGIVENLHDSEEVEDEDSDYDDGEACPVCGQINRWGSCQTCEHYIGVVIDGHMLESPLLSRLWNTWSELCRKEICYLPNEVLRAWSKHLDIPREVVDIFRQYAESTQRDCSASEIVEIFHDAFGVMEGGCSFNGGMLSGSVFSLYAMDPSVIVDADSGLSRLLFDLQETECE